MRGRLLIELAPRLRSYRLDPIKRTSRHSGANYLFGQRRYQNIYIHDQRLPNQRPATTSTNATMSTTDTLTISDQATRDAIEHGWTAVRYSHDDVKRPSAVHASRSSEPRYSGEIWSDNGRVVGAMTPYRRIRWSKMELDRDAAQSNVAIARETWKNPGLIHLLQPRDPRRSSRPPDSHLGEILPPRLHHGVPDLPGVIPGYLLAAASSDRIHLAAGPRGIAIVGSALRVARLCHAGLPPAVGGHHRDARLRRLGQRAAGRRVERVDRAGSTPQRTARLAHAFYGLGAAVAPLIASAMVDTYRLPWYDFYYIPLSLAAAELCVGAAAFWQEDRAEFRRKNTYTVGSSSGGSSPTTAACAPRSGPAPPGSCPCSCCSTWAWRSR
ncbi:hypothetical protein MRB53_038159 [Persea americana]|nr:hypothetical protein MRB53_038159 [Persea americana]